MRTGAKIKSLFFSSSEDRIYIFLFCKLFWCHAFFLLFHACKDSLLFFVPFSYCLSCCLIAKLTEKNLMFGFVSSTSANLCCWEVDSASECQETWHCFSFFIPVCTNSLLYSVLDSFLAKSPIINFFWSEATDWPKTFTTWQ